MRRISSRREGGAGEEEGEGRGGEGRERGICWHMLAFQSHMLAYAPSKKFAYVD
jgi:hypothetical protein